jgi:hypothetical protein
MKEMHSRTRSMVVGALASTVLMIAPVQATAQAPEVWTTVRHDVTFTQSFPEDICGPRASTETWRVWTEVNNLTQLPDGSFAFTDFETGTILVDFDDPSIPDSSSQFTNTFQKNLTRGETLIVTETFHQFFAIDLRVSYRLHLTEVEGTPRVSKEIIKVTGCP